MALRNEFAAVLLVTVDHKLILQLRDNKPTIADPGKLSIFAGRLEEGESAKNGAARELFEETTLQHDGLEFYAEFTKDPARHGAAGTCHVYVMRDVDTHNVDVREGQGYRLVANVDELNEENTALISLDIIRAFVREKGL